MELTRALTDYVNNNGVAKYHRVYHPGSHTRTSSGFYVHMPDSFLQLSSSTVDILAFPFPSQRPLMRCRCGFVEKVFYFQLGKTGFMVCGAKIMDRAQILAQEDDTRNEMRIMSLLQPVGLLMPLRDSHFLRWNHACDQYNQYIVSEFAANGSLISYVIYTISQWAENAATQLLEAGYSYDDPKLIKSKMARLVGDQWLGRGLDIFYSVIKALDYMHSTANVAHLDFDPCNIVIDHKERVRIIDFGSSQEMNKENGTYIVGDGSKPLIKFKPHFVAKELKENNYSKPPRRGFVGYLADMYSAGVILYQLICWGYPGGDGAIVQCPKWKEKFFSHYKGEHAPPRRNCYLCYYKIPIPNYIADILYCLLQDNPFNRWSAHQVKVYMESQGAKIVGDRLLCQGIPPRPPALLYNSGVPIFSPERPRRQVHRGVEITPNKRSLAQRTPEFPTFKRFRGFEGPDQDENGSDGKGAPSSA